ncbi:hypothetical protein S40293_06654 [Stachybotrys chartarum IBT 40293]|nr:hypothetical protein S40293_06654 [Stachybotrys chartarum IBT 40293]
MEYLRKDSRVKSSSDVNTSPIFTEAVRREVLRSSASLKGDDGRRPFSQYGLLAGDANGQSTDPRIFFNVSAPSSTFICGSQDTGGSPCEAAFLSSNPDIKVRVLCAPTNIAQIKRIYAKLPRITIEELRINESDLNTQRMLEMMAVQSIQGTMPLYLHVVIRILRELRIEQQAKATTFDYGRFKQMLNAETMTKGQLAPLQQRLETLESFMVQKQAKSYDMFKPSKKPKVQKPKDQGRNGKEKNVKQEFGTSWAPKAKHLTVVDLSCPCVTPEMACSLFGICLSLFLEQESSIGRVVALDEAHKYMNDSAECQSLTDALLSTIRLQRHVAARILISTQEPTISPRLLDLCSVTIVHRFTSPVWMDALKKHLAGASTWAEQLNDSDSSNMEEDIQKGSGIQPLILRSTDITASLFARIVTLETGEALLFAPSAVIGVKKNIKREFSSYIKEDAAREDSQSGCGCFTKEPGTFRGSALRADMNGSEHGTPKGNDGNGKSNRPGHERPRFHDDGLIRLGPGVLMVRIRKRVTTDGGRSIMAS